MQNENVSLKEFVENFFKKLNAAIIWDGKIMTVTQVPKNFESFIGKSAPYKLVFDPSPSTQDVELITKGSFFLSTIANFLKSPAKNSLLKMNFQEINSEEEIKSRFTFLNAKIKSIKQKHKYDFFSRFTFSTVFQYLNEKENLVKTIYIKNGKIMNPFDLGETTDGNKREFMVEENHSDYNSAKEELRKTILEKSKSITDELKTSLDKETKRIEEHFTVQIKEIRQEYEHTLSQIHSLKEERQKNKDIDRIDKRLEKLFQQKERIEKENKIEELEREMKLILSDEKSKRSLNISTSLLNAAIIYYPVYEYETTLESSEGAKSQVKISFDPLQKYMTPLNSEYSQEPIYKIHICAGGHVCKPDELAECIETGKAYCAKFMEKCSHCHKPVYKNNSSVCSVTGKRYAKSYVKKDCVTNRDVYFNLLDTCESCSGKTTKENIKSCPSCKRRTCKNCEKKAFVNGSIKLACKSCS